MSCEFLLPFPDNYARTFNVDVPWAYKDKGFNGFEQVQKYRTHCPYPTMSLTQVKEEVGREVNRVRQEHAQLWFWTTKDFLKESFDIIEHWGFLYKQTFVWVKTKKSDPESPVMGMGHWGRNCCEFLLLAVTKGSKLKDVGLRNRSRLLTAHYVPREGHSRKPDYFYEMIAENSDGPRLSIFERSEREGFESFGDQL